jgi:hypothetical protein
VECGDLFQHHTCSWHWLNTAVSGTAVSQHLIVPVLHIFQLDIFYLFAAAPCCRPPYFQPWFTCPTVRQLPASPHSPIFHAVCRTIHHYGKKVRQLTIMRHGYVFSYLVDSLSLLSPTAAPPYLTTLPTLRLNIGPRTAAVASCRSSYFSHGRAVIPV